MRSLCKTICEAVFKGSIRNTGILREWDVIHRKSVQNSKTESLPQTDRWYRNGWIESVISHIEYNNRLIVNFGIVFAEVYFFMTSVDLVK